MNVPFYKPSLGPEEIDEVVATLKSGWLTTGPRVKQFEEEFARFLGHAHAVAVNSCTAALHLALDAVGVKEGDTVVVPTMTFAATAEVERYFNAHPLLVDCRREDLNLDVADTEAKINCALKRGERVVAIIPMHYGGQIGDAAGVRHLAHRYQLKVVEDAAHCCPGFYRDGDGETWKAVGAEADISCYSFYANKTITTGEGGMACTHNESYAQRMRITSLHGLSRDAWKRFADGGSWYYEIVAPGFKYNLTDIAAAIGLHQVRKAKQFHERRTALADWYTERLQDVDELVLPEAQPNRVHSWHLYPLRLRLDRLKIDRARFIVELKERGVGTTVHWMPLHLHPYYRERYGYAPGDFPIATALYPELISLPLYPDMTEEEVNHVCHSIKEILSRNRAPNNG